MVLAMVFENFTLDDLDSLEFGVAFPLREALRSCRRCPPGNWPVDAYQLIGREDMAKNTSTASPDDPKDVGYSAFGIKADEITSKDLDALPSGNYEPKSGS